MLVTQDADKRWELYKVLGEPQRLRLLALAGSEELSIGELGDLLGDSQPNVSRHVAALRKLGLLAERKQGTRVFVRVGERASSDPVVRDALASGRQLCEADGALGRVQEIIRRRELASREFFAKAVEQRGPVDQASFPAELPAYLAVLAPLIGRRRLAIEIGTGDGRLLEALAPVFDKVLAVDREQAQLDRAAERLARRGHDNVQLLRGDLGDPQLAAAAASLGGADAVFASRVLHHAPRPADAVRELAALVRPGGQLLILDYLAHDDETMRDEQADLWLGFGDGELHGLAAAAGLEPAPIVELPAAFHPAGPDAHLTWQLLAARRPQ